MTPEAKKLIAKARQKSKGAFKKARHTEPKAGGGLPEGITRGIARVTDWKINEKEGKISVSIIGSVLLPEDYRGLRFNRMHFLSESEYNTLEEAYEGFYSDIQLLGFDTTDDAHEDLEPAFNDLETAKEERRYFTFNTWKGSGKNSRVKHFISGVPDEEEIAALEAELGDDGDGDGDGEDEGEDEGEEPEVEDEGEEETEEETEEEEFIPSVGETYGWKANSKAKVVNVDITKVDEKKQTVSIKKPDKKVVQNVKFSALLDAI